MTVWSKDELLEVLTFNRKTTIWWKEAGTVSRGSKLGLCQVQHLKPLMMPWSKVTTAEWMQLPACPALRACRPLGLKHHEGSSQQNMSVTQVCISVLSQQHKCGMCVLVEWWGLNCRGPNPNTTSDSYKLITVCKFSNFCYWIVWKVLGSPESFGIRSKTHWFQECRMNICTKGTSLHGQVAQPRCISRTRTIRLNLGVCIAKWYLFKPDFPVPYKCLQ